MVRFLCQVAILLFLSFIGFSQVNEVQGDSGFEEADTIKIIQPLSVDQLEKYVSSQEDAMDRIIIGGQVISIFQEVIDNAQLAVKLDGQNLDTLRTKDGLFIFPITDIHKEILLDFNFSHPDYHPLDTSFVFSGNEPLVISVKLTPKYKILLRGRIYAGNIPIEGAEVEILHDGETHKLKTLGCYYDDEDYWNCLFDGMFKQELTANTPADSIRLKIISKGMKTLEKGLTFSEFSGDIMNIKMKYASKLPEMTSNNLNLKLAFPFATSDHDWFVDISYYRAFNKTNLKRLAWGINGNMYVSTISVSYPTFTNLEPATADSSYITGFLGPSLLFWILSPDRRRFSTYTGCTFSIQFKNPQLVLQPFIGTRYFLDINKALSIEFRYSEYDRDVTHYEFNPYGNASPYTQSEHFIKFQINLGIQIVF